MRQCELVDLCRSSVYYQPQPVSPADLALMRRIDELHLAYLFFGSRRLVRMLQRAGIEVGRLHVATLMRLMGIEAIYRKKRTTIPAQGHKIYPYLLRDVPIERPNQVWATDITYASKPDAAKSRPGAAYCAIPPGGGGPAFRKDGAAQGWQSVSSRSQCQVPRQRHAPGDSARHQRAQAGGSRPRIARNATARIAEDAGHRHARRRHRARFQQRAGDHPGQRRAGAPGRERQSAGACEPGGDPQGRVARALVRQILSFSRRQPTERKRTALAPIIEESARLLRATLPARVLVEVHCDAEVPPVQADATQIQQVLINLGSNAMQAMRGRPGRIVLRLDTVMLDAAMADAHPALRTLHHRHPGRTVRLAVSDDGPGMDAATLARIFEPFFTTKPVDEGTGLGLAVVHGIVQTHEGAIEVASAPGEGASFTLYLPVAAAPSGAPPGDSEGAAATAPAPSLKSGQQSGALHILYLDDDESLVFLVKRLLERRGFRVSGYIDQSEALAALRADPRRFDLVVSDYNMPGMSGLEVAREVRAIRADLPVAVVSGFVDETLRAEAGGAGVRELIFKADAVEDFCAVVQRLAQAVTPENS